MEDYRQAVLHVGGDVQVMDLDPSMTVSKVLHEIDGLMLSGGEDVAPELYGQPPHPSVVDVNRARDEFEIALINEARSADVPILAICRGLQVLNVACGGTLVQDIPSQLQGALDHRLSVPPHQPFSLAHEVWLEKDSLLTTLMRERLRDADTCETNSRHHQAVQQLAAGFKVGATAPDGVIEAIEYPKARFCLAVQWHPENFWRTGEFRPLFEGFVEAAAKTRSRT
jgi:putative glutamine amidotransferase